MKIHYWELNYNNQQVYCFFVIKQVGIVYSPHLSKVKVELGHNTLEKITEFLYKYKNKFSEDMKEGRARVMDVDDDFIYDLIENAKNEKIPELRHNFSALLNLIKQNDKI